MEAAAEALHELSPHSVVLFRDNLLDRFVCHVRDCFGSHPNSESYAVFPNGSVANLCFKRRRTPDVHTMAHIGVNELRRYFQKEARAQSRMVDNAIRIMGQRHIESVSTESLMGFETERLPEALQTSIDAWMTVLRSWGICGNRTTIRGVLLPNWGQRPPSPHEHTIFNAEEVRRSLTPQEQRAWWRAE